MKNKKDTRLFLRLENDLRKVLFEATESQGISTSQYVRDLIKTNVSRDFPDRCVKHHH